MKEGYPMNVNTLIAVAIAVINAENAAIEQHEDETIDLDPWEQW